LEALSGKAVLFLVASFSSKGGVRSVVYEKRGAAIPPAQLKLIQEIAQTIRYGSITLVFQDGVLIQIDKSEKIRIPKI
jgi:hypothetical protein